MGEARPSSEAAPSRPSRVEQIDRIERATAALRSAVFVAPANDRQKAEAAALLLHAALAGAVAALGEDAATDTQSLLTSVTNGSATLTAAVLAAAAQPVPDKHVVRQLVERFNRGVALCERVQNWPGMWTAYRNLFADFAHDLIDVDAVLSRRVMAFGNRLRSDADKEGQVRQYRICSTQIRQALEQLLR